MNNKQILVAAAALLFTLGSCKKKTTLSTISKTKTEYLTQSTWKLTSVMMSNNGSTPVEAISSYLPCQLDNIFKFSTNSAFTQTEGLTKCATTDPDTIYTGNWQFLTNETFLKITDNSGLDKSLKVITLDATTFKGELNDSSVSSSILLYTWKH
jgi:hypothetical protein